MMLRTLAKCLLLAGALTFGALAAVAGLGLAAVLVLPVLGIAAVAVAEVAAAGANVRQRAGRVVFVFQPHRLAERIGQRPGDRSASRADMLERSRRRLARRRLELLGQLPRAERVHEVDVPRRTVEDGQGAWVGVDDQLRVGLVGIESVLESDVHEIFLEIH